MSELPDLNRHLITDSTYVPALTDILFSLHLLRVLTFVENYFPLTSNKDVCMYAKLEHKTQDFSSALYLINDDFSGSDMF